MPTILNSLRFRVLAITGRGYRLFLRNGFWTEGLIKDGTWRAGERILEVSAPGCSVSSKLATQFKSAKFFAAQPAAAWSSKRKKLSRNVEYLDCHDGHIEGRAAFFDKVVCSFALHPLSPSNKLTLLKEIRRVLRHGGTIHLAELDEPQTSRESGMLRVTSFLFGPATAKPHLDGSWFKLIQQAGFVGVRRVTSSAEIGARVALIRARRA